MGHKGYTAKLTPEGIRLRDFKRRYNLLLKDDQFQIDILARLSEIGGEVRRARYNHFVTIKDLAVAAGVSRKAITRLEKGEGVKLETLVRVLEVLGERIKIR